MKICGIDPSISSTGICVIDTDDNLDITSIAFAGYCGVNKRCIQSGNVYVHPVGTSYKTLSMPARQDTAYPVIRRCLEGVDFVSIEGYALGTDRSNSVFQLGEFIGGIKKMVWDMDIPYYIFPPNVSKLYAAGIGNALKCHMVQAFHVKHPDLFPPEFDTLASDESPICDMVDAFWLGHLLLDKKRYELKKSVSQEVIGALESKSGKDKTSIAETLPIQH
jgi:Holliday junction resolvasome RuvABC endonuclease subunit